MQPKRRIYLDHHGGAPLDPRVKEAMRAVLEEGFFANPSSTHQEGRKARQALEEARERVASALEVSPLEVVFVSGGTE
ncbi:MAG: aminotransferase class V-fold PLP-dependent enzyme, partial [Deltaproteobacteria bacterium]|nr:aminotransferase class V-fold PLP-dependent enzyme [Deltaproteobacteria bacterium]